MEKKDVNMVTEMVLKKYDGKNSFDMNLLERLNRLLVESKKHTGDIAREMGITHNTLNTFIHQSRGTNFRSRLKIKAYLDKELVEDKK